jgi:hypothetical protein
MDSLINAAARALAAGDPVAALKRVALRNDPPALALRGIAMAQVGDLARARELLRSAARSFGAKEAMARARCVLAEAEVALAARDLGWPAKSLESARSTLEAHGDRANAAHARLLDARHLLLVGRLDEAERKLAALDAAFLPPALKAVLQLATAALAIRRVRTGEALEALARAKPFPPEARIPALMAEVDHAGLALEAPAARLIVNDAVSLLRLAEVESLFASRSLVVDACSHVVRHGSRVVSLARRPVLFALVRALAQAWPGDAARSDLIAGVFRTQRADESHRARVRVEMARLRNALKAMAEVRATDRGFALVPHGAAKVAVLAPPAEGDHAAVMALLADGESWSSSALALALAASQRTIQRALDELAASGRVQPIGRARARRWIAPGGAGFATVLLLPGPVVSG